MSKGNVALTVLVCLFLVAGLLCGILACTGVSHPSGTAGDYMALLGMILLAFLGTIGVRLLGTVGLFFTGLAFLLCLALLYGKKTPCPKKLAIPLTAFCLVPAILCILPFFLY